MNALTRGIRNLRVPKFGKRKSKKPKWEPRTYTPYVHKKPEPRTKFDEKFDATLTIGLLAPRKWPRIRITSRAHGKMWALVQECDIEIGWLSTCGRTEDGNFVIDDVYVPDQRCSCASTTITKDGEAKNLETLFMAGNREAINRLNCWGHSHVNMAVFSSGQDDKQTDEWLERHANDHFLRVICNKQGEIFATIFDHESGLIINCPKLDIEDSKPEDWSAWAKEQIEEHVERMTFNHAPGMEAEFDLYEIPFDLLQQWHTSGTLSPELYQELLTERKARSLAKRKLHDEENEEDQDQEQVHG